MSNIDVSCDCLRVKKLSVFMALRIDGTYCKYQVVIYSKGFGSISHVVVRYVNCIGC